MPDQQLADDALRVAAAAGIHQLALDTPFGVGTVNTYLIEDDPLTLVDCGPNTATELTRLEQLLGERGHSLGDLEQIIVTHQHLDHVGLASTLAARSGAELISLDLLAPVLARWEEHSIAADDDALALMRRHGVEPHVAEALRAVANITRGFGASSRVTRTVSDGGTLALADRSFSVHHRPGHSPSDTIFHDQARGIALLGDHLLASISSNALIARPLAGDGGERSEPLLEYRRSLRATRELDISIGLAGHGQPVLDHRSLIDSRLRAQERRAEHFYGLLADGPRSAHELASMRWGQVAVTQAFLTLSEVLGHLGLLIADGRVLEDDAGEVVRFERAD